MNKKIFFVLLGFGLLCSGCGSPNTAQTPKASSGTEVAASTTSPETAKPGSGLTEPISGGLSRVSKKTFGLYVSPGHSPISPERFTGYHTGIDFETTPQEQKADVDIFAACSGKLLLKEYASGYGGVAVQSCVLNGQNVTLIYGHLRLSSIIPNKGDSVAAGQKIAVLGTGYSTETDGERRHLHFGIHIGTTVNILGYVQKKADLSGWIDPEQFLK
jgi:murein DD-endopeptidase MepM/ murein hydrolase activator NlpD